MRRTTRNRRRASTDRRRAFGGSRADRKSDIALDASHPPGHDSRAEDRGGLLEVHGFDLMSQIEAMFRHVREYQREVQRLRGFLGKGQTATSQMTPLAAVRHHLREMYEASAAFGETLGDARRVADSLQPADEPGT